MIGFKNNISYLTDVLALPEVSSASVDTSFIDKYQPQVTETTPLELILAALFILLKRNENAVQSPWDIKNGWQLNLEGLQEIRFLLDDSKHSIKINLSKNTFKINKQTFTAHAELHQETLLATIDETIIHAIVFQFNDEIYLKHHGKEFQISLYNPHTFYDRKEESAGHLSAPMPGTVVAVMTQDGKTVKRGDDLIVIEAMKMEHTIHAPISGTVKKIHYKVGDLVDEGEDLMEFEGEK